MIDGIAGNSTFYEYDLAGRNVASTVRDNDNVYDLIASGTTSYADGTGFVDKQTTTIYASDNSVAKHLIYNYSYYEPTSSAGAGAIGSLNVNGESYSYVYDTLGRLITRKTSIGAENENLSILQQLNTGKREEYTYVNNGDGTTTTLISSFRDMLGVLHTYEYDGNGNITKETIGEVGASDSKVKTYYYDSQNRLTRYNDSELFITVKYVYDARGNIEKYSMHPYSAGEGAVIENTVHIYNYAYENSTWKDLATSIKGYTITYDAIGNPLRWTDNRTLTWENGRQLKTVNKNGSGTTYMYNGDGLRAEKWGDRTTQYIILDGTYLGEKTSFYGGINYLITYIYGAEGSVIGLDVNGTAYYFVKNLQGDVTSIIDVNGNVVANYTYDAYGYCMSITDGNGNEVTSATHIANLNPFRYRGYMYDQETGFYYLRSRYYDPAVCRFLNADGLTTTGQGFDGNNMFAYCGNNPINRSDTSGRLWRVIVGLVALGLGLLLNSCEKANTSSPRSRLAKAPDLDINTAPSANYNCYGNAIGKEIVDNPIGYKKGDTVEETFAAVQKDLGGEANCRKLDSIDSPVEDGWYKVAMMCGEDDYHFIRLTEDGWYNKSGYDFNLRGCFVSEEYVASNTWYTTGIYNERVVIYDGPKDIVYYNQNGPLYFAVRIGWDEG